MEMMSSKEKLPNEDEIFDLADLFKIFGDSSRIKIMYTISEEELCVQEIASKVSMTQSAVSHQLRVLKNSRLVKSRKNGKEVFYSLDDDHVSIIFNKGLEHLREKEGNYGA